MKRIFSFLLAAALLSGCSAAPKAPEVELPTEPPEMVGAPLAPDTEQPPEDEVWVQIEHGRGEAAMSLSLPESWQYELLEEVEGYVWQFGIRFRPAGAGETECLAMYFCEEPYAVCGTGLETEEVTFDSGHTAVIGTYDGGPLWSYILFQDTAGSYVVQNEGAENWWSAYGDTAMEIVNTIRIGVP